MRKLYPWWKVQDLKPIKNFINIKIYISYEEGKKNYEFGSRVFFKIVKKFSWKNYLGLIFINKYEITAN